MCYGYNDLGEVPADSLTGGERFILYTETIAGWDRIARREVNDGVPSVTSWIIDPVTDVHAWTVGLLNPCPGGEADWRIVAMASDGRYVYVRLFEETSPVQPRHVLTCYDIVNRTARWAAPTVIADNGTVPPASTGVFDPEVHNSMHICVASSTRIAVNREWDDIPPLHGAGQHAYGISFYDSTTGAFVATGFGNAFEAGWTPTDGYAAGPICSDGTNVYFTVRAYASGGGAFQASDYYAVGMCSIANPTAVPAGSIATATDLSTWNPNPWPAPYWLQGPKSLVYDGKLVWFSTRFAVTGWNPVPGVNELRFFGFDNTRKYIFGPMAFDGKHLYVGISDVDASLHCVSLYHIVRFSPASIAIGSATGAVGTFEPLIDVATGYEIYPCVLDRNFMWACEAPLYFNGAFLFIDWTLEHPFGNMVYDGDTIWWTKSWWQNGAPPITGRCLALQRLANVRGV
jgi:hypothetical protein